MTPTDPEILARIARALVEHLPLLFGGPSNTNRQLDFDARGNFIGVRQWPNQFGSTRWVYDAQGQLVMMQELPEPFDGEQPTSAGNRGDEPNAEAGSGPGHEQQPLPPEPPPA